MRSSKAIGSGEWWSEAAARRDAGLDAVWLNARRVERDARITAGGAIARTGDAQLDPLRACLGFARAASDRGARIFERSTVRRIKAGVSIEEAASKYLEQAVSQGFQLASAESVTLRGALAYRAQGVVGSPAGTLRVWITWIAHGDDVFRLVGTSLTKRHEPVFLAVARSFQPIGPDALLGVEEQRLRLATAQPDEDIAALSRRTRNRWDVQQTAVMNGLYADQTLATGQALKVAVLEKYQPRKEEEAP